MVFEIIPKAWFGTLFCHAMVIINLNIWWHRKNYSNSSPLAFVPSVRNNLSPYKILIELANLEGAVLKMEIEEEALNKFSVYV